MQARLYRFIIVMGILAGIVFFAEPVRASSVSVSIQAYTENGGSSTRTYDGDTIPVGARLEVRIWFDLYGSDPVTIYWGDGTSDVVIIGVSFAKTVYHTYSTEGTYTIYATEGGGQQSTKQTINVGGTAGGSGSSLDFSGLKIVITIITFVASLGAIASMLQNFSAKLGTTPGTNPPSPWRPQQRLRPTISHSMARYLVTYDQVPVGAPVQNPELAVEMGRPTDIHEQPTCTGCSGPLGYHMNGWFCLSPNCSLLV